MTALARVVPQTFGQCGYLLEGSEHGPICRQTAGVADSQVRSLTPQLPRSAGRADNVAWLRGPDWLDLHSIFLRAPPIICQDVPLRHRSDTKRRLRRRSGLYWDSRTRSRLMPRSDASPVLGHRPRSDSSSRVRSLPPLKGPRYPARIPGASSPWLTSWVRQARDSVSLPAGSPRLRHRCPHASSQAASLLSEPPETKKASGSIGKRRRTPRPGFPSPANFSASSMEGAVIRTLRVKTPSRISTLTRITLVLLFSFCPSLRAPRCVSVPGAEGLWSRRYCEAGGRGISQKGY